jgi:hypothetical protein
MKFFLRLPPNAERSSLPPWVRQILLRHHASGSAFSRCCARAASGHATAPPSSDMNSRLFTR